MNHRVQDVRGQHGLCSTPFNSFKYRRIACALIDVLFEVFAGAIVCTPVVHCEQAGKFSARYALFDSYCPSRSHNLYSNAMLYNKAQKYVISVRIISCMLNTEA